VKGTLPKKMAAAVERVGDTGVSHRQEKRVSWRRLIGGEKGNTRGKKGGGLNPPS